MVDECLGDGRIGDAIAVNRFFSSLDTTFLKVFVSKGDGCNRAGLTRFAMDYYKKACLLDPGDAEATARLKELSVLIKK